MLPTGGRHSGRDRTRQQGDQQRTVRAFVGSYHWGYFVLDESGTERDRLTLSSGDELRLTLFNVEAEAAVDALPQAVRTNILSEADRARRNDQAIPVPRGTSLETLHDAAEAAYPDHGLVILRDEYLGRRSAGPGRGPGGDGQVGPWGGHHGPHGGPAGPWQGPGQPDGPGPMSGDGPGMGGYGWGGASGVMLAPPVYLWHHSTVPTELGFVVDTSGSFGFACPIYCGYGHPYMAERGRVVVTES
ncbi:hypothetical protein [Haloarchaeobius baliensis]|uniref:hypothetical protein n=1 Tax=Haloarchaeobius baliensis TaxID=1670458 RepID=UPI003F8819E1